MRKCHMSLLYQYLANTVHTLPEKTDEKRTNMKQKAISCIRHVIKKILYLKCLISRNISKVSGNCKQGSSFTLVPSIKFVNITTCSTFSCQIMNQKSPTVFCLGPVKTYWKKIIMTYQLVFSSIHNSKNNSSNLDIKNYLELQYRRFLLRTPLRHMHIINNYACNMYT